MARKKLIDGIENVARVFRALPRESLEEITHALNLGGKEIVDAAEVLVPVDEGALKGTVKARRPVIRSDEKAVVVRVVAGDTRETANAAFRQEFGRSPSGGHPGHPPQEFMWPAYYAKRKRVRSRVKRAINKAAKMAARRG